MSENKIDDKAVVILKKLISDKLAQNASANIEQGLYNFDVTVNVKGRYHKENDYETLQVNKIDTWLLLAVAMSKLNNVTMESIVKTALEDENMEELAKSLKERSKNAMLSLKGKTKRMNNGAVKVKTIYTDILKSNIELATDIEEES